MAAQPLYQDLWRLQNMLAVSDGYVAAHMTTKRFVEVLNRLETEVTGQPRTVIPSRAIVRIAAPLDLGERLDEYRASRRAAVKSATDEAPAAHCRHAAGELVDLGTPLAV